MKRLLASIGIALLVLTACTLPSKGQNKPAVGVRDGGPVAAACVELVAQANTSPGVVVPGSYECITTDAQSVLSSWVGGTTGDQAWAKYAAQPPSFTHYYVCGQDATYPASLGTYYWVDMRVGQSKEVKDKHYQVGFRVNSAGLVDVVHFAPGYVDKDSCVGNVYK